MKNKIMMIITGLSLAGSASAHPRERRGPPDFKAQFCGDEIPDPQRTQMRDENLKFADERIDLEAKEKHARVDLMKALSGKSSDAAIRKAALAAAEARAKLQVAEEVNRTEVLLKVFKPEQREKAIHCLMSPPHGGPFAGPMGPGHRPPPPPHVAEQDDDGGPAPDPIAAAE